MHGLKRGRDEEGDQPASSKFARRDYATDVTSASRIQHILAPGTVLPLWGLGDADGVLGYITVDDNKIDIGGSAFIVGGKTADGYKVALKVFTTPMHDYQVTLIRRELATVRKLAPHPNILSFLGTCPHQNAVLVSPLMCNGNLLRYLERNPATDRHKLVVQVAEAVCHVHDVLKLVHGDLKCENVLISDEGDALLADFGLSTAIEKAASDVTTVSDIRQKSTFRFNAPELMLDEVEDVDDSGRLRVRSKTTATDMYAFGMLILQAFTSQRPWPHLRHEMQIIATVCNKRRIHPRPDAQSHAVAVGFTDQHWTICSSCWTFEPYDRPNIWDVLSALVLVQPTTRSVRQPSVVARIPPEQAEQALDQPYRGVAPRPRSGPQEPNLGSEESPVQQPGIMDYLKPGPAGPDSTQQQQQQQGQQQLIQEFPHLRPGSLRAQIPFGRQTHPMAYQQPQNLLAHRMPPSLSTGSSSLSFAEKILQQQQLQAQRQRQNRRRAVHVRGQIMPGRMSDRTPSPDQLQQHVQQLRQQEQPWYVDPLDHMNTAVPTAPHPDMQYYYPPTHQHRDAHSGY